MCLKPLLLSFILVISLVAEVPNFACSRLSDSKADVDQNQAIEIAKRDAIKTYKSLEPYKILVRETKKKWYVDFKLKDEEMNGGGPHYIISKKTGKILKKVYWQ